ncbi:hypothetical protein [Corynebacterium variabile]|uniref:hypothetical protein n=1 Tax=Corynebacterium variabile TaxID=1727 RepID=UPI003F9CA3FA
MSGMGFPCDPSFYESAPVTVPRDELQAVCERLAAANDINTEARRINAEQTQEKAMTDTTTAYAQAVLDNAEGRICQADLDKAEQVATTAHEEEQAFLAGMLSDFRDDALRSAARTTGIDRKFWLTVADKLT